MSTPDVPESPVRVRRVTVAVAASLGLALAGCSTSPSTSTDTSTSSAVDGVRAVSTAEGHALLESAPADLVVLDVRTPAEFAEGHLPGAVNIDLQSGSFREQVAELDRDAPVLLYCRTGNRSAQAREIMADLGFTSVADVGGIVAWQEAGLPVEG